MLAPSVEMVNKLGRDVWRVGMGEVVVEGVNEDVDAGVEMDVDTLVVGGERGGVGVDVGRRNWRSCSLSVLYLGICFMGTSMAFAG